MIRIAIFAAVVALAIGHQQHHAHNIRVGEKVTGLHDPQVMDKEHIKEHLQDVANINESAMTNAELEFHYFKLHDFDSDSRLDGLEIYQALTHLMPYEESEELAANDKNRLDKGQTTKQLQEEKRDEATKYYADIVDNVLKEDDLDGDGYLTYAEYALARKKEDAGQAAAGTANANTHQ